MKKQLYATDAREAIRASIVSALLGVLALGGSVSAAAAAPDAAQPSAAAAGPSAPQELLNEVVVTAQRKEERLQDVGISVTALGSDQLQQMAVTEATDLVRAVPSLKLNAFSSSAVVWNIRGVSQNDYGDQQEPPVAVYQDDSYSSSINTASFPTFDLARVEVLRGPQGTLFGRNATGGAIQFISNKPTKDFESYASETIGSFNGNIVEAAVSGPLRDNLQVRLAGIKDNDDGYITDVSPGEDKFGAANHYALRGMLAWQPFDGTNVGLTLRYLRANRERTGGAYGFQPACPNANLQGAIVGPNQLCSFWGNTVPGSDGNNYRNDGITPSRGGDPWSTAATASPTLGALGTDRRIWDSALRVDSKIAGYDLVSVTDYQYWTKNYLEDDDSSPQQDSNFYINNWVSQLSQELRASHTYGNNDLTVGLFGMHIIGHYVGGFPIYFIGYVPSVRYSEDTTSYAGFAQDEWKFADQFKLIAGLRYWHDERVASYYGNTPADPALSTQPDVTIIFNTHQVYPNGSNLTPADADKNYDGVTARLELDYKPSDNILYYLSYNRGGKSGGFTFSTGTPFAPGQVAFLNGMPYKPEVLTDYEAGAKVTLNNTTAINASFYHYSYDNYQAFAQVGTTQTLVNLHAVANGMEIELNSHPITGLTLQLSPAFEQSRVYHILLPDFVSVVNHDLPQAPHFSGNASANYDFPLGTGTGSVGTDVTYQGHTCFTILCAPVEHEGAYAVAGARIGFKPAGGHWEFNAFVHNMLDRAYRQYAFDASQFSGVALGVYAPPRTWGLSATYRFGK
ncbi:MAG: TonB-dependent receptor [Steroidobacteraceae bacterium]